jgi:hypothetical protein
MRLRKQDTQGDYQFGHNGADFWYNQVEGVGQAIATRLLLYRGEWFLDAQEGTPWGGFPLNPQVVAQGQVLGMHTELTRDVALRVRVLETPGVQTIDVYASQVDTSTRQFSVQMIVTTIYGRLGFQVTPIVERPYFVLNWSALTGSAPL